MLTPEIFYELFPRLKTKITDELRPSFEAWMPLVLTFFNGSNITAEEKPLNYIKGLWVAHLMVLHWLPNNEIGEGVDQGDHASSSVSVGRVSQSTSRITYAEFLTDASLSRTSYGSELAMYLRTSGPSMMVT